jgi:hypothetical protein
VSGRAAAAGRPRLVLAGARLDALARKWRFEAAAEAARLGVVITPPPALSRPWRAAGIRRGMVPGRPEATSVSSYALAGLMDQLEEIYPPARPG